MLTHRRAAAALTAILGGVLLTGCSSAREHAAADAAARFSDAVAKKDGAAACAQLASATRSELEQSSGQPCRKAVLEEKLPSVTRPVDVHAYETMAQVQYADETLFLALFDYGWRVTAAGCSPQGPDQPYDCTVQGG